MTTATDFIISLINKDVTRLLKMYFPADDGPDSGLLINHLLAEEQVSGDFRYTATLLSDDPEIEIEQVQGKMVCFELLREDGSKRYFNGHCFEFALQRVENGLAVYEMLLKPWLALFTLRRDHYIFHQKNITEQTKELFCETGLSRHEFRLKSSDPIRTFSCQYGETDYNYLHRRWEEMGWLYWYEHTMEGHRLVLADTSPDCAAVDGKSGILYHHDGGSNKHDAILKWSPGRKLVSGKVALTQFDFKKPVPQQVKLDSDQMQGDIHKIEVHQYEGLYGFADQAHGEKIARRRVQQIDADGQQFRGKGNSRQIQPGRWFHLRRDAEFSALAGQNANAPDDYFILSCKHTIDNNYLNASGKGASYANEFTCVKRNVAWRPEPGFNSSAVHVGGNDTATVTGRAGEEIYTDEYGRIKIQFHWDRRGKFDEQSSAWVRVMTPWADNHFGMIAIPRVGTEVVVQFLQGNPDRPMVIGQVYNQRHMPPWPLPANQTQSGILTRSSKGGSPANANALRFEDKKGAEEIWLHAEKDQRIEVEHNEQHSVGHDRKKTVGHNETTLIKLNRMETVGVLYDLNVGAIMATMVGVAQTTKVGKTISISAGDKIELVCGDSKFVMTPDAIYLEAKDIHIKAGSKVHVDGPADVMLNSGTAQSPPASTPPDAADGEN